MTTTKSMIRVGPGRVVTMHYVMKNASAEILVSTLDKEPVTFMFGSGDILPGLEAPLAGLRIGEQKSFTLPEATPGLDQTFYFDIIIEDVRWAPAPGSPTTEPPAKEKQMDCGPGCDC